MAPSAKPPSSRHTTSLRDLASPRVQSQQYVDKVFAERGVRGLPGFIVDGPAELARDGDEHPQSVERRFPAFVEPLPESGDLAPLLAGLRSPFFLEIGEDLLRDVGRRRLD